LKPIFTDDQRRLLLEQTRKAIADATLEAEKSLPPLQAPAPASAPVPARPDVVDKYIPEIELALPPLPPADIKSSLDEMSPEERKQLQEQVRKALEDVKGE
jgi:DNA-binding MarR family transcriptional regulator